VEQFSVDHLINPEIQKVSTELAPHLTGPLTAVNLTIIDDSGKRVLDHVSVEMNLGKAWRSSVKATAAANIWQKPSAD
jgi:putative ABC transport system ATP-binding protein